jgi:hypothetical protein
VAFVVYHLIFLIIWSGSYPEEEVKYIPYGDKHENIA